jgi:hypothetical protein
MASPKIGRLLVRLFCIFLTSQRRFCFVIGQRKILDVKLVQIIAQG